MAILRLKSPVGNSAERDSIWPGGWLNRLGFEAHYALGVHTGVDLIRTNGAHPGKPVYTIADGIVKFADAIPVNVSTTWGNLVVIYHGMVVDDDGVSKQLYSRYAHLQGIAVEKDKPVDSNTQIGTIGKGPPEGKMEHHLHFDISVGDALFKNAGDWPKENAGLVRKNYRNPEIWLRKELTLTHDANGVPVSGDTPATSPISPELWVVIIPTKIRRELNMPDGDYPAGAIFPLDINPQEQVLEDCIWVQISNSHKVFGGSWVKKRRQDNSEIYISKKST